MWYKNEDEEGKSEEPASSSSPLANLGTLQNALPDVAGGSSGSGGNQE
jgi:hypothetical protein